MADLDRVRRWAAALIDLHLDPAVWSFGFDAAKTRAGLCDYGKKRITVSRHLAGRYDDDEIHQVLLHEVAHAVAAVQTRIDRPSAPAAAQDRTVMHSYFQ